MKNQSSFGESLTYPARGVKKSSLIFHSPPVVPIGLLLFFLGRGPPIAPRKNRHDPKERSVKAWKIKVCLEGGWFTRQGVPLTRQEGAKKGSPIFHSPLVAPIGLPLFFVDRGRPIAPRKNKRGSKKRTMGAWKIKVRLERVWLTRQGVWFTRQERAEKSLSIFDRPLVRLPRLLVLPLGEIALKKQKGTLE